MTRTQKRTTALNSDPLPPAGTPTEVVSADSLKLQNDLVKSLLPVGAFRTDDHRYYFNGIGPIPSVTTVLEVMDKPALSTWKAQQAVRALCEMQSVSGMNARLSEDEAVQVGTGRGPQEQGHCCLRGYWCTPPGRYGLQSL